MALAPALEYDEDEIGPGRVVRLPRVREENSGGVLLDLGGAEWNALEGEVRPDGSVRLVLAHLRSYARASLEMQPDGHWSVDGGAERMVGRAVPAALDALNVEPLATRASELLGKRGEGVPGNREAVQA